MRRLMLLLPVWLFVISAAFGQQLPAKRITLANSELDNLYEMDKGVYRSEQPDEEDFKALEAFGIKEVLNLRRFHSDNDEAEGTGLTLHRLKTNAHSISKKQIIEALKIIKNRKGPILIHCQHGSDRTGAVLAMYRIVFQNYTKEAAIKEMKEGGFGFHRIFSNITRLINNANIEEIKKEVQE